MLALNVDQTATDYNFEHNEAERKSKHVVWVGSSCLVMLFLFVLLNGHQDNYFAVTVKLSFFAPIAIGIFASRIAPAPMWALGLIASALLGLLTTMLWFNEPKMASTLWFLAAPLLLITGFGIRIGIVAAGLQAIVLGFAFYQLAEFYTTPFVFRFYCVYLIVAVASCVYEFTNLRARRNIEALMKRNAVLERLLPICAWCKQIRDEKGDWHLLEAYMSTHSNMSFTHSICKNCTADLSA